MLAAGRSLTSSLRLSLRATPASTTRFASSAAAGSSSSDVTPAGQTIKDLVPEDAKAFVTAEAVSGAPRAPLLPLFPVSLSILRIKFHRSVGR